ncbi:MAG: cellulose 1,4-beta-cellobiosidase [Oscillospiraceae bacterium]|nr:cellulose 1,4-beta-cellobiosidase [Oscillospiraceae bacterium]
MITKKKALAAGVMAAALTASSVLPAVSSAAGTRTKEEKFGDSTYAERFLSLYDDVITNGQENGYLSKANVASGGFGVPYHAVETMIIEAPDYGHETTSEAMSYIVWMAAMRDAIAASGKVDGATNTNDLAKAWKTLEMMVPTEQPNYWGQNGLSARVAPEYQDPTQYPAPQDPNNTGENPIFGELKSAYQNSGDKGLYLLHWLADVDDWYGFGGSAEGTEGKFTFINTFQRGEQESCWETVPHPCVEDLKYGMPGTYGLKGLFNGTSEPVAPQYAYTNAPDAEDRAIQAVYDANKWGVGDAAVSALAGKMGDQCRNNMFDKYYKKIGCQNIQQQNKGQVGEAGGQHFLMSWYTSWGGALDGQWAWQIGASHMHEFYQNPLAAYALLYDKDINAGMKSSNAKKDYEESFKRQMELYLWLQSANGPIAGGCTNSALGRYESYDKVMTTDNPTSCANSTFYDMVYQEHPVYADPGSNGWIGNQVWAVQRLAELYYDVVKDGDKYGQKIGGLSTKEALEKILDRWVAWFVENTELTDDGDYSIPASLKWSGVPAKWTGTYDANANSGLTCEIVARGSADLGCVSSLANTLIYYAAAKDAPSEDAKNANASTLEGQALYLARELLDREWELGRDDIGLSRVDHNGSLIQRFFDQDVWVQNDYNGKMPYGDDIKNGATFFSLRTMYEDDEKYADLKAAYDQYVAGGKTADALQEASDSLELTYHRFWHAGDILLATGVMSQLYPDVTPNTTPEETDPTGSTGDTTGDKILWGDANDDGTVDVADVVATAAYVGNPDANKLPERGLRNADVHANGNGITADDALAIQQYLAKIVTELPIK